METLAKRVQVTGKNAIAHSVPMGVYRHLLRRAFEGKDIALCLHRVANQRRSSDPYPANTFIERDLVFLLDMLYELLPANRLTITFDDGYDDATQFIHRYASRYQNASFIVFICPEKIIQGTGYRWDYSEFSDRGLDTVLGATQDISKENLRSELKKVGQDPRFELTSADELIKLARLSNVTLGNHSNCHFNFAKLSEKDWRAEVEQSFEDFASLFGVTGEFAFPFGTPVLQFTNEQALFIKRRYNVNVWSTCKGGNLRNHKLPYLNRFALPGHLALKTLLLDIVRHA